MDIPAVAEPIKAQPKNFYDGGLPARPGFPPEPPDRTKDPVVVLERVAPGGHEQFVLSRRLAYRDRDLGELLVPVDPGSFRTDLASVPRMFTWLVPKTGAHLPAALLHDGLVAGADEEQAYVSTDGHHVNRVQADQVFRNAMADTGTTLVRRWLVWSAVTLGSVFSNSDVGMSKALQWRYRIAMGATLAIIVYVGLCATVDLADKHVGGLVSLPWMGERSTWAELLGGAAGAVLIPFVLGLTWGRFRVAGWVGGITLSMLIHVTFFLALVSLGYVVVEKLTEWQPKVALGLGLLGLLTATGVFVVMTANGW